jgi:hypothetical protein
MATTDSAPEPDDEIPEYKKYQVNLTLDNLLTNLAERPRLVVEARAATQGIAPDMHPDIAQHLQRISELASELLQEINAINQIDPDILSRLKQA